MMHINRIARINLESGPIVSLEISETNDKQDTAASERCCTAQTVRTSA